MIWNYLTPVFYSISIIPGKYQPIFKLTPLYQLLAAAREIVLYGRAPSTINMIAITGYALIAVIVGSVVFKKNQDKFVYYI